MASFGLIVLFHRRPLVLGSRIYVLSLGGLDKNRIDPALMLLLLLLLLSPPPSPNNSSRKAFVIP